MRSIKYSSWNKFCHGADSLRRRIAVFHEGSGLDDFTKRDLRQRSARLVKDADALQSRVAALAERG